MELTGKVAGAWCRGDKLGGHRFIQTPRGKKATKRKEKEKGLFAGGRGEMTRQEREEDIP